MITLKSIFEQGRKVFPKVLLAHLQAENIFPLQVKTASLSKFNRLPLIERGKLLQNLLEREQKNNTYELVFEEVRTRNEGLQSHLRGVYFPHLEAYLQSTSFVPPPHPR